jgi:diaminohydroxyphosphoribosylaminopyrimidine deaminase/5-amino-6-(5-phosphoribosylamino)uracil reductase
LRPSLADPDERTAGEGLARLRQAGIDAMCADDAACRASLAGYLSARTRQRPHVTLKLATSLDGCIAMASGESRWITSPAARAHAHRQRARADAIVVGGGTLRADSPALDVRLPGLETRSPRRLVLTRGAAPPGWETLDLAALHQFEGVHYLLVEGGAEAAASFLVGDLVDRLLLYRAPVLIGGGRLALADVGLATLAEAHGRWRLADRRSFAPDTLEIYERTR